MRLIDVDELKELIDWTFDKPPFSRKTIKHMIDMARTVDAVPVRHGKWLPKHHYIAGYEFVSGHICSECGNDALNAEGDDFLTDFCPNCGARMDEE